MPVPSHLMPVSRRPRGRFEVKTDLTPIDPSIYKALLDQVADCVCVVYADHRIVYWNEGAARQTGYPAEEVLARRCPEDGMCHVDVGGHPLCSDSCPLVASLRDGASHEVEVFLPHKQGRRVPVTARIQPLRGPDGSIVGAVTDIQRRFRGADYRL